jgi:hypothetical protein
MEFKKHEYSIDILENKLSDLKITMLNMSDGYPGAYKENVRKRRNLEHTIAILAKLQDKDEK